MSKLYNLLTLLIFSSVWIACGSPQTEQAAASPFKDVNASTFKSLMSENPNAVILDVRTPGEYSQGNIEGSILLDVNDPAFESKVAELDKDKKYLVYCRSGQRSVTACNIMAEKGFKDLTNLVGGYQAWSENN